MSYQQLYEERGLECGCAIRADRTQYTRTCRVAQRLFLALNEASIQVRPPGVLLGLANAYRAHGGLTLLNEWWRTD
jgi:hypothetical protein